MNAAHLHLILTHLPVLGSAFGLFLLAIASCQRNEGLKRTSLWVLLLAGLVALPTYLTGRPASPLLLKAFPTLPMDPGDQHAEVAVIALVMAMLVSLTAAGGLWVSRGSNRLPAAFLSVILVLGALNVALMGWTANLGAKIRHVEIHESNVSRFPGET